MCNTGGMGEEKRVRELSSVLVVPGTGLREGGQSLPPGVVYIAGLDSGALSAFDDARAESVPEIDCLVSCSMMGSPDAPDRLTTTRQVPCPLASRLQFPLE